MLEAARNFDLLTNSTERSTVAFYQQMMYENSRDESIFTPANLKAMCEFEASFANFKMAAKKSVSIETTTDGWLDSDLCPSTLNYEDYCLLDSSTKACSSPSSGIWSGSASVVSLFYGDDLVGADGVTWDCTELSQTSVDATAAFLVGEMDTPEGQVTYGFFMGKNTVEDGFTPVTRSAIAVAGPLCVAAGGVAGNGKCYDNAASGLDIASDQALSYMNNLVDARLRGGGLRHRGHIFQQHVRIPPHAR